MKPRFNFVPSNQDQVHPRLTSLFPPPRPVATKLEQAEADGGEDQGEGASTRNRNNSEFPRRANVIACNLAILLLLLGLSLPSFLSAQDSNFQANVEELSGPELAREIRTAAPASNTITTGQFRRRDANREWHEIPVQITARVEGRQWWTVYQATGAGGKIHRLAIRKTAEETPVYYEPGSYEDLTCLLERSEDCGAAKNPAPETDLMQSFAGADFNRADLGLQFLYWPEQRIVESRITMRRGRPAVQLESVHPDPGPNGYAKVASWIDRETGAILEATAYDRNGDKWKTFEPDSVTKVDGEWQVKSVEMRNHKTRTQTKLIFDLN